MGVFRFIFLFQNLYSSKKMGVINTKLAAVP